MPDLPKTERILLDITDDWLTISFNHLDSRNALSQQLTDEIRLTLKSIQNDKTIRGITFRGEGGIFCAGGDLKSFKSGLQGDNSNLADVEKMSESTGEFFELINTIPVPVIMLAEGAAMAGGLGMLCAADIVVVTKDCKFALTETTLGIVPAQIAPYIVSRVGLSKARRLMLTASRFTGKEAFDYGIADFIASQNSKKIGSLHSLIGMLIASSLVITLYILFKGTFEDVFLWENIHGISMGILHGILMAIALLLFFHALAIGKISIVSPIMAAHPVFVICFFIFLVNHLLFYKC